MTGIPASQDSEAAMSASLDKVRDLMAKALGGTALDSVLGGFKQMLGQGKMLRARLAHRVGPATQTPEETLLTAAAAVELVHAASLLHDDVIDGGYVRRGAPTFWVERGVPGAILLGDLMLFRALALVGRVEDGRLTPRLIHATGEVCEAESEQELVLRGGRPTWANCVSIARRKTGALFAFMAYASGGADEQVRDALYQAGSKVGTAYQLADDILDATGNAELAGKSLGSDEARAKTTAVSATLGQDDDPVAYIEELCREASAVVAPWPGVQASWDAYVEQDIRPALDRNLASFSRASGA